MLNESSKSEIKNFRFSPTDQMYGFTRNDLTQSNSLRKYTKKFPIHFIAAKDWKLYVHFLGKLRKRGHIKPKTRSQRLMNSFIKLYDEYTHVCDDILPKEKIEIDENDSRRLTEDKGFTYNGSFETLLPVADNPKNLGGFSAITKCDDDVNGQIKRWVVNKLRSVRSRKFNYSIPYDKIVPYENEAVEIYLNEKMQNLISHKISFTGFDSLGHPMIKWIDVPIALELLIPKVQIKIQRIMISCNFLYDPLEVAAELRYFNYSVDLCISHFNRTRKFRDILQEFLPQKSQLKELVAYPQLLQRFQNFFEKMKSGDIVCFKTDKGNMFDSNTANNRTIENAVQFDQGDNGRTSNSINKSKLIKIVSFIEKLKVSRCDTNKLISKWKLKYKKQIADYSKVIVRALEAFKDFLMTEEQRCRVLHLLKQNDELKLKLKEEEKKRKTIYNMMQDQLGNVRVYCRCRAVEMHQNVLDVKTNDTVIIQTGFGEEYKFDKVFEYFRTQTDVYEEVQPLILSFIDGFNVCFITYGGEASGKTYTLLGSEVTNTGAKEIDKHDGIMKRALKEILSEEVLRRRDWEYQLTGSVVEIYNDSYKDLLADKIGIHLPIDGGLEKIQEALKSVYIKNDSDIEKLIKVCKVDRKIGRTALNHHSSRSHLVVIIHLVGRSKIHGERISSFLGLCDLAGFEDILKAETHNNQTLSKEAGYINKSLTAFNRMFTSLRRQDPSYVSYRDTKLTYILKPFLTNHGKCSLIVTVRTDKSSISSTQSTLRFGRESRGVALGKTKRQTNLDKVT